jgi:hypothetical protein
MTANKEIGQRRDGGRLPDRAAVTRVKEFWGRRLTALAEVLAPQ